ncbi:MAG: heavy-metal-associated domain-containing protein [Pseudomonadota bacterium]
METTIVKIKGMTCMGCVGSVQRVLQGLSGVKKVDVSLDQGQARVEYDSAVAGPVQFKTAIEDAGYEVA